MKSRPVVTITFVFIFLSLAAVVVLSLLLALAVSRAATGTLPSSLVDSAIPDDWTLVSEKNTTNAACFYWLEPSSCGAIERQYTTADGAYRSMDRFRESLESSGWLVDDGRYPGYPQGYDVLGMERRAGFFRDRQCAYSQGLSRIRLCALFEGHTARINAVSSVDAPG